MNNQENAIPVCSLIIKKPTDFIKITSMVTLIYGQPGTRKTSYAGTAPRPVLFDFDNGMKRVDENYRCAFVPAEYLKNWNDVEAQLSHPQFEDFDTFIFDSVTKLIDYMAEFIMKKDLKNKKSGGGLSLAGYGSLGDLFKSFLAKMEMMNKNIVFVAHDKEAKEGDSTRLRPDIVGSSLGFVTRSADMMGYVEMINNESVVQFTPTDRFYAKNSCGIEPQFPTSKYSLADVIEKYKVGVNAKSAENKIYKLAMNDGLQLLNDAIDVKTLNDAYTGLKKLQHALTSKSELSIAFKERAEVLECFFNKEKNAFDSFDSADLEAENTDSLEPKETTETVADEEPEPDKIPSNKKSKKDEN